MLANKQGTPRVDLERSGVCVLQVAPSIVEHRKVTTMSGRFSGACAAACLCRRVAERAVVLLVRVGTGVNLAARSNPDKGGNNQG